MKVKRRPQTRIASTNDHNIEFVFLFYLVSGKVFVIDFIPQTLLRDDRQCHDLHQDVIVNKTHTIKYDCNDNDASEIRDRDFF